MLNARGIRLVMRCDTVSGGWRSVRQFIHSQQTEATVMLSAPRGQDAADWPMRSQVCSASCRGYCWPSATPSR
jgi:hypothetical protein